MPPRQYRRGRSPHAGVKLKARQRMSGTVYRAIYVDPDSEREVYETLTPQDARTMETRRAWAIDKSKQLARRRSELETGAPRAKGMSLKDAIDAYYEAHPQLRPRTVKTYRNATDKLQAWAAKSGVKSADDLTRAKLLDFRKRLITQPKHASRKNGKRGEALPATETRGAVVVNQELRSVGTVLRYLYELDLLAHVGFDDLRRGLKMLKAGTDAPDFLTPAECAQLLRAALKHDAETFTETRAEHVGEGRERIGTTNRYPAIAPFVATVLLTGMRVGEALALRWSYIDLDTVDVDGQAAGELRLPSEATKTKQGRRVALDVCPQLRELLAAMKERAGDAAYVFGGDAAHERDVIEAARKRLIASYEAPPKFTWQLLRSTCATVSCNAPSLWGAAAVFVSSKRLGQSVVICEKRYAGQLAVSRTARTLEAAMTVEPELRQLVARARAHVRVDEQPQRNEVVERPAGRHTVLSRARSA